ncbi:YihY/virulence factor BrkB family protein [Angustibacter aerolatus]
MSRNEPDPEDPRKPDGPTDLEKPSLKFALKRALKEFSNDQCTDLAAALTYYAVLSLFPALIALVSLLGVFGKGKQSVDTLLGIVEQVGAGSAVDSIRGPVEQLASSQKAGLGLIIGLLTALWSASGYVGAFGRALNRIYEVEEGRPIWKLRPVQLLVTLISLVLVALMIGALIVTGPVATAVGDALGIGSTVVTVWNIAKWPVIAIVAILVVALLYYSTPNVKQPKFRWISVGAVIALVTWVIASALFGFYVANFSSYNKTYGALAGVIVFLLWLWITNLALLFGAEVDSELERGRELQAGIEAEVDLRLPVRDDKNIRKKAAKEAEDAAEGRRIREESGN